MHRRPGLVRGRQQPLVIHRKYRPAFSRLEQVEALLDDHPDARIARRRHTPADADRIVAAEARHIDLRVAGEGAQIAGIAKPPDRAGVAVLELRLFPSIAAPSVK